MTGRAILVGILAVLLAAVPAGAAAEVTHPGENVARPTAVGDVVRAQQATPALEIDAERGDGLLENLAFFAPSSPAAKPAAAGAGSAGEKPRAP